MIQTALVFIKKTLDQYLVNRFHLDGSIAVLNHLVNPDGSYPEKNKNKMVITLLNLDHGANKQYQDMQSGAQVGRAARVNPAIQFNFDLLFTASFDDYEEGLKFLNATIAFFRSNYVFNSTTSPDIPSGIKWLNFEIENVPYLEAHKLWSALGAKYQPSILYRVRCVTVQGNEISESVSEVASAAAS